MGAIESLRDITERKHAEEAIQKSEREYRTLFENANDMVFTPPGPDRTAAQMVGLREQLHESVLLQGSRCPDRPVGSVEEYVAIDPE